MSPPYIPYMAEFLTKVGDTYLNRTGVAGTVAKGSLNSTMMTTWLNDNMWTYTVYVRSLVTFYAYGIIVLTIIYSFSPISSMVNRYVISSQSEAETGKDQLYMEHVKFFDKDYDTFNSLTAKAGKLRLL